MKYYENRFSAKVTAKQKIQAQWNQNLSASDRLYFNIMYILKHAVFSQIVSMEIQYVCKFKVSLIISNILNNNLANV